VEFGFTFGIQDVRGNGTATSIVGVIERNAIMCALTHLHHPEQQTRRPSLRCLLFVCIENRHPLNLFVSQLLLMLNQQPSYTSAMRRPYYCLTLFTINRKDSTRSDFVLPLLVLVHDFVENSVRGWVFDGKTKDISDGRWRGGRGRGLTSLEVRDIRPAVQG
jgi:hypothetical protein